MSKRFFATFALLVMAILTLSCEVLAEETEELQTGEVLAEEAEEHVLADEKTVTFMFVQNAQSGTLIPVEGEDNLYTLTLVGVAPQTIAFSDRPERVVVQVPMQKFLDGMGFSAENPPNAALEILDADEEEDLAVVELFDPVYDAASQTLQYNVSILEEQDHSYAVFNERADQALPETFGAVALFIDDCPCVWKPLEGSCDSNCYSFSWDWLKFNCEPDGGCCSKCYISPGGYFW